MEDLRKKIIETGLQLPEHKKSALLLFTYALLDGKEEASRFTLEEITYAIEVLEKFEAESNGEYNCKDKIEWLQAIKAERENG